MAFEIERAGLGAFITQADLSANQFYFVKITSTSLIALCTASTDVPLGVLQNKPKLGQSASVYQATSITKVVAGAALTVGTLVMPDTSSRAIPAATAGNTICGLVLVGAANLGEIATIQLIQYAKF